MLELTVLSVPGCPNEPVLRDRLAHVLAGYPEARVTVTVVETEAEAGRYGMHGSPTLLVNGTDPFALPGMPASVSCRVYRDETGGTSGAPSVAELAEALRGARGGGPAGAVGRAGRGRVAPVEGGLRAVHQAVLRAFAQTGRSPSPDVLDEAAAPFGASGAQVMRALHAEDFLRLDADGAISAAYPFSATPTAHRVTVHGGPTVHAMCAVDALGMAAMLGKDVTVTSAEPITGLPVTITVPADGTPPHWQPETAVVFYGEESGSTCCRPNRTAPPVAADTCCGTISFFTTPVAATAWAKQHPDVTGRIMGRREAWQTGVAIFAPLLR